MISPITAILNIALFSFAIVVMYFAYEPHVTTVSAARAAFLTEVGHWDPELGLGEPEDPDTGLGEAAAARVATGNAPAVEAAGPARREAFLASTASAPWPANWAPESISPGRSTTILPGCNPEVRSP